MFIKLFYSFLGLWLEILKRCFAETKPFRTTKETPSCIQHITITILISKIYKLKELLI